LGNPLGFSPKTLNGASSEFFCAGGVLAKALSR
jgi:hypothetical protein